MGSDAVALAVGSPSKSTGFPKGMATAIACTLAESGTVSVGCRTAASGGAIVGVAGRSCFGLDKGPTGPTASRVLCMGTSDVAPISDAFVAAKRVVTMARAPFSFGAPGAVTPSIAGFRGRRVGFNGNFSRG